MRAPVVALVDALLVLVFALTGRASHDEANAVLGVLTTAWPFLAGAAVGWAVGHVLRRRPLGLQLGAIVWVCTVVGGMLLRQATGRGTALSFIIVATIILGVLLLGWRLLATRITASRST